MADPATSQFFAVHCHCKSNVFHFSVPTPIPKDLLEVHTCLCTTCRLVTGCLAGTFSLAPSQPFDPANPPSTIKTYRTSDSAARYFCPICSSHLFFRFEIKKFTDGPSNGFWIDTGCLDIPEGVQLGYSSIGFICDTKDGGLASWVPGVKVTKTFSDEVTEEDIHQLETHTSASIHSSATEEKLEGRCCCGSVKLSLIRPNKNKWDILPPNTFSDNTDLVIPEWTPAEQKPPIDHQNPWWIREAHPSISPPSNSKPRFLAGLCTCNTCRRISGVSVQAWLFVPTDCITLTLPSGKSVPWPSSTHHTDHETFNSPELENVIHVYTSNKDITRGSCKTCGSNIWWNGLTRKKFIDLSAGLFTERGTREEGWVEWWTERVSYVEDLEGKFDLGARLEKGLKEWRKRIGGKV